VDGDGEKVSVSVSVGMTIMKVMSARVIVRKDECEHECEDRV